MLCGIALAVLQGCAAVSTFSTAARPGDTVALATGWNQNVNRANLTAVITDSQGTVVPYSAGDSRVRAVVRLYPDPVSRLMVETATGQSNGMALMNGPLIGQTINERYTFSDADWNQMVVYLDLPSTLAEGIATIALSGPSGPLTNGTSDDTPQGQPVIVSPIKVNVLPGVGSSNSFRTQGSGSASLSLPLLERRSYYTVTFTGSTIPDAIQIDLTHPAGTAIPWVVNPRGDLKNAAWHADGSTNLRVILTTSHGEPLADMKHFKFYVASGIPLAGLLSVANVAAYDAMGNPVDGVTANASYTQ